MDNEPQINNDRPAKETRQEENTHARELAPKIISLLKEDFKDFVDKVESSIEKSENVYPLNTGENTCLYVPSLKEQVWLHSIKINDSIIKVPWFGGVTGSLSPEPYGKPLDYFYMINKPDELEKFLNSELKNYTRIYGTENIGSSLEEDETAKYPAWLFRNSQNIEFKEKFIGKLNLLLEQELRKEPLSEDKVLDKFIKERREIEFENSKRAVTLWKGSINESETEWFYKDPQKNFWLTKKARDEELITEGESKEIVDLLESKNWDIEKVPAEIIERLRDIKMMIREKYDRETIVPGEYAGQFERICSIINTLILCRLSKKELSLVVKVIKDCIEKTKMLPNIELSLRPFYNTKVNPYSLVQQLTSL